MENKHKIRCKRCIPTKAENVGKKMKIKAWDPYTKDFYPSLFG